MLIFNYQYILKTILQTISIVFFSVFIFLWINQNWADKTWEQFYHKPPPWMYFSSSFWACGEYIEAPLLNIVVEIEGKLSPFQDIMEDPSDITDKDLDDNLFYMEMDKQDMAISNEDSSDILNDISLLPKKNSYSFSSNIDKDLEKNNSDNLKLTAKDHVLFIGDSMMQGVAPHVITELHRHYDIQSYDLSLQSTGLAYPKFFNWPQTLRDTLKNRDLIKVIVVFMGPNDPWDMPDENGKTYLEFRSKKWGDQYRDRIRDILNQAQQRHIKVIWIGPPAMKKKNLSEGILYINKLYQEEVEKSGQKYISGDQIFHYKDHQYNEYMNYYDNYIKLRTHDGTHFTVIGQKIIAHSIMQELMPYLQ